MMPTDFTSVLLRPITRRPSNTRHRAETVSRYARIWPLILPMAQEGLPLNEIARRLTKLAVMTPEGLPRWHHAQVSRLIEIVGLTDVYEQAKARKRERRIRSCRGLRPEVSPSVTPSV